MNIKNKVITLFIILNLAIASLMFIMTIHKWESQETLETINVAEKTVKLENTSDQINFYNLTKDNRVEQCYINNNKYTKFIGYKEKDSIETTIMAYNERDISIIVIFNDSDNKNNEAIDVIYNFLYTIGINEVTKQNIIDQFNLFNDYGECTNSLIGCDISYFKQRKYGFKTDGNGVDTEIVEDNKTILMVSISNIEQ